MGRCTTNLAAAVANADNLPPKDKLPNISLWDAFLPLKKKKPSPDKKKVCLSYTLCMTNVMVSSSA